MATLWERGEATVDEVVRSQPPRRRRAYNTVQTVMNRLVERGLLERERRGRGFAYRPRYDEATYVSGLISDQLASASAGARLAALHALVGELEPDDLDEVTRYANRIKRARKG